MYMPGFRDKMVTTFSTLFKHKFFNNLRRGLQEEVDRAKTTSFNNDLHIKRNSSKWISKT